MKHYQHETAEIAHRQAQLMREAEVDRMLQAQQIYQPGLAARVLTNVGEWMIAGGTRLKLRYKAHTNQPQRHSGYAKA
ncbi:MAG: hypothetical protein K8L97_04235 [Anaerolineae bacterium]|nr:hypothetical protein [Anaerolineae bacterium]